jgi:hypothetical protein
MKKQDKNKDKRGKDEKKKKQGENREMSRSPRRCKCTPSSRMYLVLSGERKLSHYLTPHHRTKNQEPKPSACS